MELELLYGIFSRLGHYYTHRGLTGKQYCNKQQEKVEPTWSVEEILKDRDSYLHSRNRDLKKGRVHPDEIMKTHTAGCSISMASSGYSSHRQSMTPSPVGESVEPDGDFRDQSVGCDDDLRTRVWVVCKSGVVPARIVRRRENRSPPNDQMEQSLKEISLEPGKKDTIPRTRQDSGHGDMEEICDDLLNVEDGRMVEVELEESGEMLSIETKFIEKAGDCDSSSNWDPLDHNTQLNQSELVGVLSGRFRGGEYQTKLTKECLVSINPMKRTERGSGRSSRRGRETEINGEEDILKQQVEDIYREALLTGQTQSLVLTGRSGSGKSCNFKKALSYLLETTQGEGEGRFSLEKMYAVDTLLESFCSTRTLLNTHATRMVQLVQIHFDQFGEAVGGGVELALPDTARILRTGRNRGEPTFPILYQVQAALCNASLFLPPEILMNNAFFTPLQDETEIMTALEDWSRVCVALEVLGVTQEEEESFWLILAAITNLGVLVKQMEDKGPSEADPLITDKVAEILGVSAQDLWRVIQRPATPRTASPANSLITSCASSRCSSPDGSTSLTVNSSVPVPPPFTQESGMPSIHDPLLLDNVRRLSLNLYSDLLSHLVTLINRSIKPAPSVLSQHCSVILFDSPGFQNPADVDEGQSAGFVELCYNYLQERVQDLFTNSQYDHLTERDRSVAKLMSTKNHSSSSPIVNLLERTSPSLSRTTSTIGRRNSKRVRFNQAPPGLFTLLHKATNCPWSDDSTFVQRLTTHWGGQKQRTLIESVGGTEFILHHMHGTNPVRYSAKGWRQISYNMGRTNLATEILRKTDRLELKMMGEAHLLSGSFGLPGPNLSLDEVKARTSCLQVKMQVDTVMRLLSGTKVSFVLCVQPHRLAGLCELFRKSPGKNLNQRLLREQIQGDQLLEYLVAQREAGRLQEVLATSRAALIKLSRDSGDHLAVVDPRGCTEQRGLATALWQGLQVAVLSAMSHLDILESLVSQSVLSLSSSTTSTVAGGVVSNGLSQVLLDPDTGLLMLQNGRVSLNLDVV